MAKQAITRYDRISQLIHWATAILAIAAFTLGPEHFGRLMKQGLDPATRWDIVWHETLGVAILGLTLLRFVWMALRPPAPRFEMPEPMHLAARAMHWLLLLLLVLLPVTALLALGGEGHPLTLVGGFRIDQMPLVLNSGLAHLADWGDIHGFLGDSLITLAGVHAAAAIFHHVVLKGGVLLAMKPAGGKFGA